jgi:hypothetical protein
MASGRKGLQRRLPGTMTGQLAYWSAAEIAKTVSANGCSIGTISMTEVYTHKDIRISLGKRGLDQYAKVSYPPSYGVFSEIETRNAVLRFNLNDEIIYARGKGREWPHPQEWLKRTMGNDWIYYSTGGYTGVFEAVGEYYLPNTPYPTNSLLGGRPFLLPAVASMIESWPSLLREAADRLGAAPAGIRDFFAGALANDPERLQEKAGSLRKITGGRVTVLPPDARHVDYDVIPLTIAEGCLYKCRFCRVKSNRPFREKSPAEIDLQIKGLRELYGRNLGNYNSLFLGEHDALCAGPGLIMATIEKAYAAFGFAAGNMRGGNVFLFGSVDSLLAAPDRLFAEMAGLPCNIYLNIGLESADQETLDRLGKPLDAEKIVEAFGRSRDINERYFNIEVTVNFIMDESLPANHYPAFLHLVREGLARVRPKGCVYLSPLQIDRPSRSLVMAFHRLKILSRLPTFLYIIQRL